MLQADLGCSIHSDTSATFRRPLNNACMVLRYHSREQSLLSLSALRSGSHRVPTTETESQSRERRLLALLLSILGSPPSPLSLLSPPPLLPFPASARATHWPQGKLNLDLSPAHEKCCRVKTLQRPAKSCHSLALCQWPSPGSFRAK